MERGGRTSHPNRSQFARMLDQTGADSLVNTQLPSVRLRHILDEESSCLRNGKDSRQLFGEERDSAVISARRSVGLLYSAEVSTTACFHFRIYETAHTFHFEMCFLSGLVVKAQMLRALWK